jgi:3-hydroxybutyrate dehydrogenase
MLKGKVALITGSTSGIGLGIAEALAAEGVNLVINGLGDAGQIEAIRADLAKKHNVEVMYHGADMTKPDAISDMVVQAEKKFGRLDILVNNAGIQHVAAIDEFPPEKWEQIISINLVSNFHTIRGALPLMKKQGWGRVVNIASAHALVASPFKSAYNAAKHGVAGLTKTVALEVAQQKITVNAICPGYVRTPLVEKQIGDQAKTRGISEEDVIKNVILGAQPTKQFTTVEQIGGFVVFLCSDHAANITGAMLPIDGGWTAN